jgi:hypothetical protein
MIVNESLPVIADPVLGGGVQGVAVSTVLIVMCVPRIFVDTCPLPAFLLDNSPWVTRSFLMSRCVALSCFESSVTSRVDPPFQFPILHPLTPHPSVQIRGDHSTKPVQPTWALPWSENGRANALSDVRFGMSAPPRLCTRPKSGLIDGLGAGYHCLAYCQIFGLGYWTSSGAYLSSCRCVLLVCPSVSLREAIFPIELKELIALHSTSETHGGDLRPETVKIVNTALDLQQKVVKEVNLFTTFVVVNS